jgi:biotin carboxyl carrier protein
MIFEVAEKKSKGEPRRIELREIDESQYEIEIDGKTVHVDAAKSGRTVWSVIENGRQFEVSVDEKGPRDFDIQVRGRLYHLEAVDERSKLLAETSKMAASGPQTVEAEMPGKVVLVKAAVGDTVAEGQGVVVVEAMKMENEIPSPIDGVVTDLPVSEGDTVENGAALFTVEPPAEA